MQSINPATNDVLKEFEIISLEDAIKIGEEVREAQKKWRKKSVIDRSGYIKKLGEVLREHTKEYARLISLEMGKPITQAIAEVEKCAVLCDFYAQQSEGFLAPIVVRTEAKKSYLRFDPLGVVLAIMPWNYPFWQVIRCAVPALAAGNTMLLKHASNVPQCSLAIEEAFTLAGFPENTFRSLLIPGKEADKLIETHVVDAVSLTGSTQAGAKVAETAGRHIKKCVLELGGSDPYILFEDANVELATSQALTARMQNCGQSCIAAKRFIVHSSLVEKFEKRMKELFATLVVGDPIDEKTTVGPLAKKEFADGIEKQVEGSIAMGAEVLFGGHRFAGKDAYFEPTLLRNITPEMPVWKEEVFGPVMAYMSFETPDEAVEIANTQLYGLGASLWTEDRAFAEELASQIESGFVSINAMVKSDPRLPFGGVKQSGFGREMGEAGIKEFTNMKTIVVQ